MAQRHAYRHVYSYVSVKKVLRQVEDLERQGWEFYQLYPLGIHFFGSGALDGLTAIMRRAAADTDV